jgi:hypothetical protein
LGDEDMRRIQTALTVALTIETIGIIYQAYGFVQRISVTADGTVVPSAWFYPSIFSGAFVLLVAVLLSAYLLLLPPTTRTLFVGSVVVFLLGTIGLWSFHRAIVSIEASVMAGRGGGSRRPTRRCTGLRAARCCVASALPFACGSKPVSFHPLCGREESSSSTRKDASSAGSRFASARQDRFRESGVGQDTTRAA